MSIYAINGKEPVAAWIPSATQSADDVIGATDGTLINGTSIVADTENGGTHAFHFDAVNDYIDCGNTPAIQITGELSCSIWLKMGGSPVAYESVLGKTNNSSWDNGWGIFHLSGNFRFFVNNWNANWAHVPVTLNEWVHLCVTYDNSTLKIYKNGVKGIDGSLAASIVDGGNLQIGNIGSFTSELDGREDDIRIFDQALDATDIADLYASGYGRGITFGNPTGNLNNSIRSMRYAL